MLNLVNIVGRLTKNPELKKTEDDNSFVAITIASNRDNSDETDFIDCLCFNTVADNVVKYLHKGDKIIVTGTLSTYKNKENKKVTCVKVNMIYYPDKKVTENYTSDITIPE